MVQRQRHAGDFLRALYKSIQNVFFRDVQGIGTVTGTLLVYIKLSTVVMVTIKIIHFRKFAEFSTRIEKDKSSTSATIAPRIV